MGLRAHGARRRWPTSCPTSIRPTSALALVHALAFVSRDTRGHAPRFPEPPLGDAAAGAERLAGWYRRFVETRSADAAERTLATAVASGRVARRRAR